MADQTLEHFRWPHSGSPMFNAGLGEWLGEEVRLAEFVSGRHVAWRLYPSWFSEKTFGEGGVLSWLEARGVFCETAEMAADCQDLFDNFGAMRYG